MIERPSANLIVPSVAFGLCVDSQQKSHTIFHDTERRNPSKLTHSNVTEMQSLNMLRIRLQDHQIFLVIKLWKMLQRMAGTKRQNILLPFLDNMVCKIIKDYKMLLNHIQRTHVKLLTWKI